MEPRSQSEEKLLPFTLEGKQFETVGQDLINKIKEAHLVLKEAQDQEDAAKAALEAASTNLSIVAKRQNELIAKLSGKLELLQEMQGAAQQQKQAQDAQTSQAPPTPSQGATSVPVSDGEGLKPKIDPKKVAAASKAASEQMKPLSAGSQKVAEA